MGTNYYTKTKECSACHHKPEGIHLGKSSAGWQFSFQYNGGKYYKNIQEMVDWLADKEIVNEYGELISHEQFWKEIEAPGRKKMLNHAEYMHKNHPDHAGDYVIDGYSFSDCDFS